MPSVHQSAMFIIQLCQLPLVELLNHVLLQSFGEGLRLIMVVLDLLGRRGSQPPVLTASKHEMKYEIYMITWDFGRVLERCYV